MLQFATARRDTAPHLACALFTPRAAALTSRHCLSLPVCLPQVITSTRDTFSDMFDDDQTLM